MESFANLDQLVKMVQKYEWFRATGLDEYGRFVIYVSKMDYNILKDIPAKINNQQVLFHFFYSPRQYVNSIETLMPQIKSSSMTPQVSKEELDIVELVSTLDELETIYGSNIIVEIFFETHDKKNAVTNLSDRFPEVRKIMDRLYNQYGFDLIYEQLEL